MRIYLLFLSLFFCGLTFAQNSISGSVSDRNGQPIPGVNVKVIGQDASTATDFDGKFILKSVLSLPVKIEISSLGFTTQILTVRSYNEKISVKLLDEETKLNEIVVSASRTPERVLESPVTIERMGIAEIKKTASPSFYIININNHILLYNTIILPIIQSFPDLPAHTDYR